MNQNAASEKDNGVTVIADPATISPYIGRDKKTVVLFEMTGCPFCRMFQPAFQTFSAGLK